MDFDARLQNASVEMQQRLNDAVSGVMQIVQTDLLKFEQRYHRCCVSCYDSTESVERAHDCAHRCEIPLQKLQHAVQTDVGEFQKRIQRSVMICQDKVQDLKEPTDEQVYRTTVDCLESMLQEQTNVALPRLRDRMRAHLEKHRD